jgi:hypothetical protein
MKIIFTNTLPLPQVPLIVDSADIEIPVPASSLIPKWYKNLDSYTNNQNNPIDSVRASNSTIKKCMPFFDAMTAGYLILLPCDVYIKQVDGEPEYTWTDFNMIDFHPLEQAPSLPQNKVHGLAIPKFNNPWSIKTPKGYSVLITSPLNHDLPFTILPAIVDTDTLYAPINFPFTLNQKGYEGMISAGTPIAQIIPFKREPWEMKLGSKNDILTILKQMSKLSTKFYGAYKTFFRQTKQYK